MEQIFRVGRRKQGEENCEMSKHYWGSSSRKGAMKKKTYSNSEVGRMVLEGTLIWVCASS